MSVTTRTAAIIKEAIVLNQHPAFDRDIVSELWYCGEAKAELALAAMRAAIKAAGTPLDIPGIQEASRLNRINQINAEIERLPYAAWSVDTGARERDLRSELVALSNLPETLTQEQAAA